MVIVKWHKTVQPPMFLDYLGRRHSLFLFVVFSHYMDNVEAHLPQHFLYFLPLPQEQESFLPVLITFLNAYLLHAMQ